ncbi:MAG: DLW-39 family protein [Jatrophihabitans sp.]
MKKLVILGAAVGGLLAISRRKKAASADAALWNEAVSTAGAARS